MTPQAKQRGVCGTIETMAQKKKFVAERDHVVPRRGRGGGHGIRRTGGTINCQRETPPTPPPMCRGGGGVAMKNQKKKK